MRYSDALTPSISIAVRQRTALPVHQDPCSALLSSSHVAFCVSLICHYALDRLSRYEATLWRQVGQILFALDALDRRKPQDKAPLSASAAGKIYRPTSPMRVGFRVGRSSTLLDELATRSNVAETNLARLQDVAGGPHRLIDRFLV